MHPKRQLLLSIVLATRNRREAVLHTLDQLGGCGLDRRDHEILIVDNASEDGTADAVRGRVDRVLRLSHNAGSCAKAYVAADGKGVAGDQFPAFAKWYADNKAAGRTIGGIAPVVEDYGSAKSGIATRPRSSSTPRRTARATRNASCSPGWRRRRARKRRPMAATTSQRSRSGKATRR